jgi:hypothetical protein
VYGFAYRLAFDTLDGRRSVLPERGVYTTSVNNRVRDAGYGFYVMNQASDHWQEFLLGKLEFAIRPGSFVKGVFLDELVYDPNVQVDAPPIDVASKADAARAAADLVERLRRARPELAIYYNGLGANEPPPGAAGVMLEGFAVAPWFIRAASAAGTAPAEVWHGQLAAACAALARGEELLLLARGSRGDWQARLFAFASSLLVRGPGTRFAYLDGACLEPPLPEWRVDLGAPLEPAPGVAVGTAGVMARTFERGRVWVNPGLRPVPLRFERPGFALALDGGRRALDWLPLAAGDQVELGPQAAVVIAYAAAPPGSRP